MGKKMTSYGSAGGKKYPKTIGGSASGQLFSGKKAPKSIGGSNKMSPWTGKTYPSTELDKG